MSERPILFADRLVLAILRGRKTQTRRPVKPQPVDAIAAWPGDVCFIGDQLHRVRESRGRHKAAAGELVGHPLPCPYGVPGDSLYVREAWHQTTAGQYVYRADYPANAIDRLENIPPAHAVRWRPSIHMPREASRIVLGVCAVRVQRLQDITDEDAIAEGVTDRDLFGLGYQGTGNALTDERHPTAGPLLRGVRAAFAISWNKLYEAKGCGWQTNPWVWAVSFVPIASDQRVPA